MVFIIGWIALVISSFVILLGLVSSFIAVIGGVLILQQGSPQSGVAKTAVPTATEVRPETAMTKTSVNIPVPSPTEPSPAVYCGYCGFKNFKDSAYCQNCGRKLTGAITAKVGPTDKFCSNCGTKNKSDSIFCEQCGKQLS